MIRIIIEAINRTRGGVDKAASEIERLTDAEQKHVDQTKKLDKERVDSHAKTLDDMSEIERQFHQNNIKEEQKFNKQRTAQLKKLGEEDVSQHKRINAELRKLEEEHNDRLAEIEARRHVALHEAEQRAISRREEAVDQQFTRELGLLREQAKARSKLDKDAIDESARAEGDRHSRRLEFEQGFQKIIQQTDDMIRGSAEDRSKAVDRIDSRFLQLGQRARKLRTDLGKALDATDDDTRVGRFFKNWRTEIDLDRDSVAKLDNQLRGVAWGLAIGFAQQLLTVLVGLGGAFVAVASSAAVAGTAIAAAMTSAAAQAVPAIGLIIAAFGRIGAVFDALKQANKEATFGGAQAAKTGEATRNALNRVREAQEALSDTERRVKDSRENLNEAIREGRRELEDLAEAELAARLQAEAATLSFDEARRTLRRSIAGGDVEGVARAQLGVDEAALELSGTQRERSRTTADARRTRAGGLEGIKGVRAAREQLKDSEKAVEKARRGLREARHDAQVAGQEVGAAASRLNDLLAQLSPAEKRLFGALKRLQQTYRDTFRPITDIMVNAFTRGVNRVEKVLDRPIITRPFTRLANSIGHSMDRISKVLTSTTVLRFFRTMTNESARSIGPITTIALQLFRLFRNVAEAGIPAFRIFLRFFSRVTKSWADSTEDRKGLEKFFIQGARWAIDWFQFAGAIVKLFAALSGAGGAATGTRIINDMTSGIDSATASIERNRIRVAQFFEDSRRVLNQVGRVLGAIGKALFEIFDPDSIKPFVDFIVDVFIPALTDLIKTFGHITGAVLAFLDLPGVSQLTKLLLTISLFGFTLQKVIAIMSLFGAGLRTMLTLVGGKAGAAAVIGSMKGVVAGLRGAFFALAGGQGIGAAIAAFKTYRTAAIGAGALTVGGAAASTVTKTGATTSTAAAATTAAGAAAGGGGLKGLLSKVRGPLGRAGMIGAGIFLATELWDSFQTESKKRSPDALEAIKALGEQSFFDEHFPQIPLVFFGKDVDADVDTAKELKVVLEGIAEGSKKINSSEARALVAQIDKLEGASEEGKKAMKELVNSAINQFSRVERAFRNVRLADTFAREIVTGFVNTGKVTKSGVDDMISQLRELPLGARRKGLETMLALAQVLEDKGKLPEGSVERLRKRADKELGKLEKDFKERGRKSVNALVVALAQESLKLSSVAERAGKVLKKAFLGPFEDVGVALIGILSDTVSTAFDYVADQVRQEDDRPRRRRRRRDRDGGRFGGFFSEGGLIPAMLSSGEVAVEPDGRSWTVPGPRSAADNVLSYLRQGTAILTDHGQSLWSSGMSLLDTVRNQLPHFGTGGYVQGAQEPTGSAGKWMRQVADYLFGRGYSATSGGEFRGTGTGHDQQWATDWGDSVNNLPNLWKILYPFRSKLEELFGPSAFAGLYDKGVKFANSKLQADHEDHIHLGVKQRIAGLISGSTSRIRDAVDRPQFRREPIYAPLFKSVPRSVRRAVGRLQDFSVPGNLAGPAGRFASSVGQSVSGLGANLREDLAAKIKVGSRRVRVDEGPTGGRFSWRGIDSVREFIPFWNQINPDIKNMASTFARIVPRESTWNRKARNYVGSGHRGWYQFDPATWMSFAPRKFKQWANADLPDIATRAAGNVFRREGLGGVQSRWASTYRRGGFAGIPRFQPGGFVRRPTASKPFGPAANLDPIDFILEALQEVSRASKGLFKALPKARSLKRAIVNMGATFSLYFENFATMFENFQTDAKTQLQKATFAISKTGEFIGRKLQPGQIIAAELGQLQDEYQVLLGERGVMSQRLKTARRSLRLARKRGDQKAIDAAQTVVNGVLTEIRTLDSAIGETVTEIGQAAEAALQASIEEINKRAERAGAGLDIRGRFADLLESAGATSSAFAQRGSILQGRGAVLQEQRSGLLDLAAKAAAQGNTDALEGLNDQIAELDISIAENTAATFENTISARQASIEAITGRGTFLTGVFSGLGQILATIGTLTGTLDVPGQQTLLQQSGQVLGQTGGGLRQQLFEGFGVDLRGLSPQALVSALSALPFDQIEANFSVSQRQQFEGLINAIIGNAQETQQNTEAIQQLTQAQTQDWSSTAWQWFRNAIFTGSGGLLPQFQIPSAASGAMITSSGVLMAHEGEVIPAGTRPWNGDGGGDFNASVFVTEQVQEAEPDVIVNRLMHRYRHER